MNRVQEAIELVSIGREMGINIKILPENESKNIIDTAMKRFRPYKREGHLGIGGNSVTLPINDWEYSYMEYLPKGVGLIFFEQKNLLNGKTVVKISDLRLLGKILKESFGMEYFLTNEKINFLIAVNWYVVEAAGIVQKDLKILNQRFN